MWAQLIKVRVQPGADVTQVVELLKTYEPPDSGLVRELVLKEQADPETAYVLAVFESEQAARAREQDPRRAEGQAAMRELLGTLLAGPPEFTDLLVAGEWVP